jgi:hypothetical protein
MKVPLAGADAAGHPTETLLSEVGLVLLRFFDTREACTLRLVCREFTEAVRVQQWEDSKTVIHGSIAAWRACFPRARCANVREWTDGETARTTPVEDSDFVHFEGLRELNMAGCDAITAAAFVHLRGIHTLNMSYCSFVTDAFLAHLVGIQRLSIEGCSQATFTAAAFVHLRGIQVLNMTCCSQLTDAAFVHLRGIHTLFMSLCDRPTISDAAFAPLAGIDTLVMHFCDQPTITGSGLAHLTGVRRLAMEHCAPQVVAAALGLGLPATTAAVGNFEPFSCTVGDALWSA